MADPRKLLDMPWAEWRSLAGLADPYATVSAEVGVPTSFSIHLTEGIVVEDYTVAVADDFDYDVLFAEYLEDHGISYDDFHRLLDEAIETGDEQLAEELLLVEEQFNEALGDVVKAGVGAVKGVAKAAAPVVKKGAQLGVKAAKVVAPVVKKAVVKGAQMGGAAVNQVAGAAGSVAGTAAGEYQKAKAATGAPAPTAQAPQPTAQAPAPTGVARVATGAKQAVGATAGAPAAAVAADTKVAKPAVAAVKSAKKVKSGVKSAKKVKLGVKPSAPKGAASGAGAAPISASVEAAWEMFLAENGITLHQLHDLMDEAAESGDAQDIDMLLALEDAFGVWLEKRTKAQQLAGRRAMAAQAKEAGTLKKAGDFSGAMAKAVQYGQDHKTAGERAKLRAQLGSQPRRIEPRTASGEMPGRRAPASSPGVNGGPKVIVDPQGAPSSPQAGAPADEVPRPPQRPAAPTSGGAGGTPPVPGQTPPQAPGQTSPEEKPDAEKKPAAKAAPKKGAGQKAPRVRGWNRIKFGTGQALGGATRAAILTPGATVGGAKKATSFLGKKKEPEKLAASVDDSMFKALVEAVRLESRAKKVREKERRYRGLAAMAKKEKIPVAKRPRDDVDPEDYVSPPRPHRRDQGRVDRAKRRALDNAPRPKGKVTLRTGYGRTVKVKKAVDWLASFDRSAIAGEVARKRAALKRAREKKGTG